MIIGHGDIASVLKGVERDDLVFFASGVSNSQETRESEYKREIDLLLEQDKRLHIVYFGSLSIFYSDTRYARHKKFMEELIKREFPRYTIVRLGNIDWGKNPHTLINYFRNMTKEGKPIEIRDEYRYVISQKEFLHWIDLIPDWPCEMNLTGQMLSIKQIIKKYVL